MKKTHKKGGFFSKLMLNKWRKVDEQRKKHQQKQISLGDGCWENHRGMILPLTKKQPKCNCYCLEKNGNTIKKKKLGNNYSKDCASPTNHEGIIKPKDKKLCPSSKYIWTSNKSKSFPLSQKCADRGRKSCWGK
jgi:hypothetical protein